MDDGEKEHINSNLSDLVDKISVSIQLLAYMEQKNILVKADTLEIDKYPNGEKSYRFLKILQTRTDSYPVFITALKKFAQTGAAEILESYYKKPGAVVKRESYHKDETVKEEGMAIMTSRENGLPDRMPSTTLVTKSRYSTYICVVFIFLVVFQVLVGCLTLTIMRPGDDDSLGLTPNVSKKDYNGSQTVVLDNGMYIYNFSR